MLSVLSKAQAVQTVLDKTASLSLSIENIELSEALGRTLAADVVAAENIPAFDRTTVDGYAVIAADTFGAGSAVPAQLEIVGEIHMGENADFSLKSGQCVRISTGGMLPQGADAAVMVEHTDSEEGLCLIYQSAAPYENVTRKGEDICCGEKVLKKGSVITAAQIAVLAALGVRQVSVFCKPVLAIISTGDEIVQEKPRLGQIRDINTDLLAAAVRQAGCEVYCYGAVKDEREAIDTALEACLARADAVLISGGSSAGTKDMTVSIIEARGEVCFHGIAMKPGKPTIFGMVAGKPVFGLPGHPLAAYFVFRLIVRTYIAARLSQAPDMPHKSGVLAVNIPSNHGREEYLCIQYNEEGAVVPVHTKSGVISVLSAAQGFIKIERNAEGLLKGTVVDIYAL
ncbi:MAG: molybdopterin molybdotransferase MoeA [Clostridia bacterium]|nr:molybdopterin molybdotransferase MoeA [Clostridia bacterium]